ncbi:MAG TPA: carbohydrate porin [Alphaproteobacteria bacterium]|nr:carbohydrate porin [Alphaproteobacteria bacterium]
MPWADAESAWARSAAGSEALPSERETPAPGPEGNAQPSAALGAAGLWTGLFQRSNLLGDMGGLRPWLGKYGVTLTLQETSEVLGNATGGTRQGAAYDGLTTMGLQLDTGKALGLEGGTFNASALQIHGRNLSAENLSSLQTASGIEANRATRLWELWYQQDVLDGLADVRLGQQSIDQEFMASQYSALFINTMMGWPMVPSADMIAGGPAYPLSSPGLRLRARPSDSMTVLAGVFDDNPAGPGAAPLGPADPQALNASGTNFRLSDSPLFIAELQYALNQPALGELDRGDKPLGLPGTYKLGLWYDAGMFADQRIDDTGRSLADPASSGVAQKRQGNYSIYAVVDQMIWRPDPDGPQAVGAFLRAMGAPETDRNLIAVSINGGLTLKAPLPGRDDDTAGIGFGYAKVSGRAAGLDRDTGFFSGARTPIRASEEFIEATYQVQLAPWWQIQPDVQYTFNPGGGVLNPGNSRRVGDEAVFGLRTNITF